VPGRDSLVSGEILRSAHTAPVLLRGNDIGATRSTYDIRNNHHHANHQHCLEDRDDVAYLTYFNAGLRVYDIRDPRQPKEIGYFVPADPKIRIGTKPSQLVAQSEDVLVDRRGFIYLSDKTHGIHILRIKQIWPYLNAKWEA